MTEQGKVTQKARLRVCHKIVSRSKIHSTNWRTVGRLAHTKTNQRNKDAQALMLND